MSDSTPVAETVVPVKVPEPADHQPSALAEPASGPAAEMSGALAKEDVSPADTKPAADAVAANGETKPTESESVKSVEEQKIPTPEPEKTAEESAPAATEQDAEMKDVDSAPAAAETSESVPASKPETNGTPASKAKRKSSAGIPEHKTKTLKKKQSKQKLTNLDASPGDYYLARLRSYPPWPSVVCDESMLPEVLLTTRPVTAMQSDGTYKEPYADGGKKVADRTYAVMFLHTNEFGWIPNTDLAPITPEECKDVSEKNKTKALIEAYKVASEGHELQHYKDMLMQHEAALQEDEQRNADKEAEKAAKAEKKKSRKSEVKPDNDVEMEDAEEVAPKKSSKKRKKEVASDDEDEPEKAAKTPKTTKLKLTTKTPTTEKKSEKKTPKPKSEKKQKKKVQESEEEVEEEKAEQAPLDPVEARKARQKEVLFLRHKLQKGFLSRDQEPSEAEMPQMGTYIKKLEAYGGDLEVAIIRETKINKVLKGIVKLVSIPKDEEYNFRERSVKLLGVWNQLLGSEPAEERSGKEEKEDKATPTTTTANGVSSDAKEEAEEKAGEKIEEKVEEPKENIMPAEKAVEKLSAEVSVEAGEKAAAVEAIQKEEKPAVEDTDEKMTDTPKTDAAAAPPAVPAVEDKAPESAEAAAEVNEVVKATE